jgi:hypothetical protein
MAHSAAAASTLTNWMRFAAELLARSGADLDQLKVTGALEEME